MIAKTPADNIAGARRLVAAQERQVERERGLLTRAYADGAAALSDADQDRGHRTAAGHRERLEASERLLDRLRAILKDLEAQGGHVMATHTPGPWHIAPRNDVCGPRTGYPNATFWICQAPNRGAPASPEDAEIDANLRLISAAPDLLAALCKWHSFMVANYKDGDISWAAETVAALAKAEGRS